MSPRKLRALLAGLEKHAEDEGFIEAIMDVVAEDDAQLSPALLRQLLDMVHVQDAKTAAAAAAGAPAAAHVNRK